MKVSVVMACYRGDEYRNFKQAVFSVLNQTYPIYEYIIVADGPLSSSVDNFLSDLKERHQVVKVLRLKENQGAACARNIGVEASAGDYIAISDSDDIMAENRIKSQVNAIIENEADCVWGWQEEFYDESLEFAGIKKCPENHEDIAKALKFRNLLSDPTTFIKRHCCPGKKYKIRITS